MDCALITSFALLAISDHADSDDHLVRPDGAPRESAACVSDGVAVDNDRPRSKPTVWGRRAAWPSATAGVGATRGRIVGRRRLDGSGQL